MPSRSTYRRRRSYRRSRGKAAAVGRATLRRSSRVRRSIRRGWNAVIPGTDRTLKFFESFTTTTSVGGTGSTSLSTFFNYSLGDFPTQLVDPYINQYKYFRVKKIYVRFIPSVQRPLATNTTALYLPEFWTAIDRDLSLTLADSSNFFSSNSAKSHNPLREIKVSWKPNTLGLSTNGQNVSGAPVVATGATIQYDQWYNTNADTVKYFGLRIYNSVSGASSQRIDYTGHVRMLVEFKGRSQT